MLRARVKFNNSIHLTNFIVDMNRLHGDVNLVVYNKNIDAKNFNDVMAIDISKTYYCNLISNIEIDNNRFNELIKKYKVEE